MESLRTCKLFGVIRAVLGIEGAVPLIHGPVGCFYHIRYLLSIRSGRPIRILCTEMDQSDVIFGGEEKLLQKIEEADKKYSPKIIAVLSSCASSIIGENMDLVLDKARGKVKSDLISINSGGFEGSQIDGYLECLEVLIDLMEGSTREDSVNLVGQYRGGRDLKVLKGYLQRINLDLNCILTAGCSLEDIKHAPRASLNISMCDASGVEPCQLMEKKFEIPYMTETLPVGVKNTSKFLEEICKVMKRRYVFAADEEKAKQEINKLKPILKGKSAVIVAGATRALALTGFICELGMEPAIISMDFEGTDTNKKLKEILKGCNKFPVILKQPDYSELLQKIKNVNSPIILGGMGELGLALEVGVPLLDVMHAQESTFGFEGSVNLARKIAEALI